MKKWGLIGGVGLLFVVLLSLFIYQRIGLEYTTETVWRDWQGKARDDGHYLAKELLKRYHNKTTVIYRFPTPTELQKNQIFITNFNLFPNKQETKQLKHWIETGGTLFIPAASTLARDLGGKVERKSRTDNPDLTVWEDQGKHFVIGMFSDCQHFQLTAGQSTGKAKNSAECETIHRFQLGRGEVIFLPENDLWHDGENLRGMQASEQDIPILQEDRAALLSYLVGENKNILWFKGQSGSPNFHFPTRWLIPIIMALLLLLFLIWRFGSRFGILLTLERPQMANLERHLQASGDLLTSIGAEEVLLHASRKRLQAELPQDYQTLLADRERLTAALEKDFSLAPSLIGEALYRQDGNFIHKMRAIEKVRVTIGRAK